MMQRLLSVALAAPRVTFAPWAENSLRIRVEPSSGTSGAATEAAAAALRRALAAKNMTDLPGALLPDHAGSPVEATPGTGTTHGNLRAALSADGTLSFSRADTG